jgi:hypothetical protein
MLRLALSLTIAVLAIPVTAQTSEKEIDCGHQADVAAAIVQARLDRVAERKLPEELAKTATWPEKYNVLIPIFAPHFYNQKRGELKDQDIRGATFEQCMSLEK